MTDPLSPLQLARGPALNNRFMLAPLTNQQSHADGTLSDEEFKWLTYRAKGGFGLTMTCAAHVQRQGQGFAGQLGIFGDQHLEGLTRMATEIRRLGSVSSVQLHHAGMRSPKELIGEAPQSASADEATGARALSTGEVEQLVEDFVTAAVRAETAGFDGVEIHGAHGYVLCQFISAETNRRDDRYGGRLENRARVVREIIDGVRARCRPDFQLGLRLSPERFGIDLGETRTLAEALMLEGKLDYLDMSLWDVNKIPGDEAYKDRSLMGWFTDLKRGDTKLGVAGKIMTGADVRACLDAGCDYVLLGRAAILHHDYPKLYAADADFSPISTPVSRRHLLDEGLSPGFVEYMNSWKGFVAAEAEREPA